ncbi:S1 family peptidase [Stackebrandtia endophytica]|uniref:S1 family peptidase n=1 Tax=Stackebrandtia endophytica TaxID=1496996 RepID=UPI0014772BF6|nr:S1 family peptidase [Stackebrandtia endophytica]
MKARRIAAVFAATAITTTTFALAGSPAAAQPAGFDEQRLELSQSVDPGMLAAMSETFGYSTDEALDRLAVESLASEAEPQLRAELGDDFAGLWLEPDSNTVHIAVTDDTISITETGYATTVVKYNETTLHNWQSTLDGTVTGDGITGTYVDVTTNQVVVDALPSAVDTATDLVEASGVPAEAVRVDVTDEAPQTLATIRGGDAYHINGSSRCSVGFAVNHSTYGNGFVTAGHCGTVGSSVTGGSGGTGQFRGSSFPGRDYAWVDADAAWTNTATVNRYDGTVVQVSNSTEAAVGASICRSGSTTGWRCGSVQAKNQSVSYPQGTVTGLTRTNACAEPGDSGGSFISGNSAQGMTSGGSGNCSFGGTTYFQPLLPALSAYGLTLQT